MNDILIQAWKILDDHCNTRHYYVCEDKSEVVDCSPVVLKNLYGTSPSSSSPTYFEMISKEETLEGLLGEIS